MDLIRLSVENEAIFVKIKAIIFMKYILTNTNKLFFLEISTISRSKHKNEITENRLQRIDSASNMLIRNRSLIGYCILDASRRFSMR